MLIVGCFGVGYLFLILFLMLINLTYVMVVVCDCVAWLLSCHGFCLGLMFLCCLVMVGVLCC